MANTLANRTEGDFRMAPFYHKSVAKPIILSRITEEDRVRALQSELSALPDKSLVYQPLPEEIDRTLYNQRIHTFLHAIRSGEIHKAILSRVILKEKPTGFDPVNTYQRLYTKYPATFAYLLYHPEAGMWMGATPELLLRKERNLYYTMGLAGTQPRRADSVYRWRDKEMEEHTVVGDHIEDVFKKYHCTVQQKAGPKAIEAARVAHLRTDYIFEAIEEMDVVGLLNELHPTPAVGGLPVREGADFIVENEGYDRKYYCGYIGELDPKGEVALYINLRNVQIGESQIAVYCGGGITAGSDPDEEWNETIEKSKTMADLLQPAEEENKHEVIG